MKKSLLLLVLWLASGCAHGPVFAPAAPPPDGQALLYFYRSPTIIMGVRTAEFSVDGKRVFDLNEGGYSFIYVAPGRHELSQVWNYGWMDMLALIPLKAPLEVGPGEERYFRFFSYTEDSDYPGFKMVWQLQEVPAEQGKQNILNKKLAKPRVEVVGPRPQASSAP